MASPFVFEIVRPSPHGPSPILPVRLDAVPKNRETLDKAIIAALGLVSPSTSTPATSTPQSRRRTVRLSLGSILYLVRLVASMASFDSDFLRSLVVLPILFCLCWTLEHFECFA